MIYSWKLGLYRRAGLCHTERRVGVGYPFNIAIVRHGGRSNIRHNILLPIDNTYNHAILVASQAITHDYLNGIHTMSNSIRNSMEATPLTLALVADCKAKKKGDETGVKAHMLLAEDGYRSTDLMAPSTKGSTCNDGQWAYFNTAFKASLSDSALKLYSYDNTNGLSDAQKVERRKIQKRFTQMTGNWRKGLARLEKAVAEADGTAVKASYETRLHEKLSTVLKQLEGKEQFNGNIVELVNTIRTSLTHIKLK